MKIYTKSYDKFIRQRLKRNPEVFLYNLYMLMILLLDKTSKFKKVIKKVTQWQPIRGTLEFHVIIISIYYSTTLKRENN